jgi:transglutaminase-like putative cysteine protease
MKRLLTLTILLLCMAAVIAAGCTTTPAPSAASKGDALFTQAEQEFQSSNLHAAENLFRLAQENYTAAGSTTAALKARDRAMSTRMMTFEFSSNRSVMDQKIAAVIPSASAADRAAWLDGNRTVTLRSDGVVWYHDDTVSNIFWGNITLMRKAHAAQNSTPFYDKLAAPAFATMETGADPFGPVLWEGTEELVVPRGDLPANGTLKLWIPLPIEYGPQTNVTIVSLEPARYLRSTTGTGADLGLAYFEIPLAEINDPFLNVSARFRFVRHSQHFSIDPAKVRPYNTSSPEYLRYTASGKNIVTTPAMKAMALAMVGNETNPYLRVKKIYHAITDTTPYSHPSILLLEQTGTPWSAYFLETGIGDCGTQSQYFAALLRSIGIPARTPIGYQMIEGTGTHVWSEYYIEGYGWIPSDVTVAEGADWSWNASSDERARYRDYYSDSLDPYRYTIQKDADIPLSPVPGNALVLSRSVFQNPDAVCDTCTDNPAILLAKDWTVSMKRE